MGNSVVFIVISICVIAALLMMLHAINNQPEDDDFSL